jgi:hypothetical protein
MHALRDRLRFRTGSIALIRTRDADFGFASTRRLRCVAAAALLLTAGAAPAAALAEELSLLGGWTDTDDHTSASYSWGLEYRERLPAHLDVSFGYLNEGHLPANHRDGARLQLWADTGLWRDRLGFSVGAGPYLYFDTLERKDVVGYANQHGVAAVLTVRASYALTSRWFTLLEVNQVIATNPATRTVMLGAGVHLDSLIGGLDRTQSGDPAAPAVADGPNELNLFGGQTTLNNIGADKSTDFGIEYRYGPLRHIEFSASVIEEGDGATNRHAGITAEGWLVQEFFARQLQVGLGAGPYTALSGYHTFDGRSGASVVGLASMTLSWRFARALAVRLNWHRGFTTDDQDRDIVTVGLGWRF